MNDISVILINYNTSTFTLQCIHSIVEKTNPKLKFQIIVVDNNSELADFQNLHDNFPKHDPRIQLHRSIINTGFGGGNMFGTQFANSKYLLFQNNDTLLQNDCLQLLYDYMERHPKVGVATAQNYDKHGNHVPCFEHFKGFRKLVLGRSFLETWFPKQHPKRKQAYQDPITVNTVNGAFMFFRASSFAAVGGFDTNIFLYFEEMDICYRLLQKGHHSVLVPKAKVLHYQGVSIGNSKTMDKESFLSYLYVLQKNYFWGKYQWIRLYYLITFLIKPKKWVLYPIVFRGAKLSKSLKQQQEINYNPNYKV